MSTWLDALRLPLTLSGSRSSLESPQSHKSQHHQRHASTTKANPSRSTLQSLVEGADVAAQFLQLKLPQEELIQQIVDFLVDPSAVGGALEWKSVAVAARYGALDLLQIQHLSSCGRGRALVCSSDAVDFAAQYGHLQVIQWLHLQYQNQIRCTKRAMDFAATNGHLKVVQWLHMNRREGCSTAAMDGAAANGHSEMVQWLHANRSEGWSARAVDFAAQNGHLETLQWLIARTQDTADTGVCMPAKYAALNGHVEVLRWLASQQTQQSSASGSSDKTKRGFVQEIRSFAAYGERPQVLRWCNDFIAA
ncbi:hypothetical protein Gpo141_00005344 [Globisporangium polare]